MEFNNKGLNFLHMNIRSLYCKNKFEMFKLQLLSSGIHIFGISESWLKKEIPSSLLDINGFNICRLDRSWSEHGKLKKGGGLCIYIKNDLVFSEQKYSQLNLSSKDIEIQCISLNQPKLREIVVVNIYRPPQGKVKEFCVKLNERLSKFNADDKREFFIMGDFNINAFNKNSEEFKELNNLMTSFGLRQFIKQTTRFSVTEKCIDHLY